MQSSEHDAKRLGSLRCQRTEFTSVEWPWKGGIRSTNYQLWRGSSKDYHSGGVEITGHCRVSVSKLHTFLDIKDDECVLTVVQCWHKPEYRLSVTFSLFVCCSCALSLHPLMSHCVYNKMGTRCNSNAISHMDVIACITVMVLGVTLLLCNHQHAHTLRIYNRYSLAIAYCMALTHRAVPLRFSTV